jgi:hypothetical protein
MNNEQKQRIIANALEIEKAPFVVLSNLLKQRKVFAMVGDFEKVTWINTLIKSTLGIE